MIMTVKPLPHSSKIVLEALVSGERMTHKDIVQRTNLSPKTARYGLKRLVQYNLISRALNVRDARQIIYRTSTAQSSDPIPAN
jgi:DNA-binding MarR family transcriptional regulator